MTDADLLPRPTAAVPLPQTTDEARRTPLGRIVSVSGANAIMMLDGDEAGTESGIQVGLLVKISVGETEIFAMTSSLCIPMPTRETAEQECRLAELEIIGELRPATETEAAMFRRGASTAPALGDLVLAADEEDLRLVYARPDQVTVQVGRLHQAPGLPAHVVVDDLLGRHFAVVGTTGAGKSCAVSLILHGIIDHHPGARAIILDAHGEYASAFGDKAELITADDLQLPYWLLTHEELVQVVLGGLQDAEQEAEALRGYVQHAKQAFAGQGGDNSPITADTPVPFKMSDMLRLMDETAGQLSKRNEVSQYYRLKSRITSLMADRRFGFLFPSNVVLRDNMAGILSRIFRIPVNGKPVAILDLSTIPSEVLDVIVAVICRMTFDVAIWSEKSLPVLLVCEEAHRYAPQRSGSFEAAKRAMTRIANEGRKHAVSLCVVTQRPSEVSSNILSQCNTMFALRLINLHDQEFLRSTLPDASKGLLEPLPMLGNGEAIAIGEGVPVPMRILLATLPADRRPSSTPRLFSGAWANDELGTDHLAWIVNRWRRQRS